MNDESAKELAAAMNRLADAIEKLSAGSFGGIQVYHHGHPLSPSVYPQHLHPYAYTGGNV